MFKLISKLETEKVVLVCILILSAYLRFYGLNWDQGYHLHPDERWLTMVAGRINWPQTLNEFLSVDSPLNPKFFAYGSLPIYLLKFTGSMASFLTLELAQYNNLNLLGRMISVFFDLGTLILVFLLGKKIWSERVGLLASFFYAIAVFPIQNAHFYTVDTQLTFWVTLTLFFLVKFLGHPKQKTATGISIAFGAALATKVTAVFLLPSIVLAVLMKVGSLRLFRSLRTSIYSLMFIFGAALFTFILLQPYALIDFNHFKSDVLLQSQMSRNATVFPYTIQYIGTTPYIYQLKNLVLWGLGAPLGILGVLGVLWLTWHVCHSEPASWRMKNPVGLLHIDGTLPRQPAGQDDTINSTLILLSFFWIYFLFVGASAVKFMRYLLPLYPILTLSASKFLLDIQEKLETNIAAKLRKLFYFLLFTFYFVITLWVFAFMQIYTQPNTRVSASEWINQNIPADAVLATEHWDDGLPLFGFEKYKNIKLNLYDPDNAEKVDELLQNITQANYIILSSNRLYDSIPKLPDRYPITTRYYQLLFTEKLGFKKIVEFTSYPKFSIFPPRRLASRRSGRAGNFQFSICDEGADESFTVYDHPKVIIFKKTKRINAETLRTFLMEF